MSNIQEVELELSVAKEMVAKAEAARRLHSNRDFKKLFLDGLFKDEASRLVGLMADPQAAAHRNEIMETMIGISVVQAFLRQTVQLGRMAAENIEAMEDEAEVLRQDAMVE